MSLKSKSCALLQWTHGEEKGKYSVLESSWILNFNVEEFNNEDFDESYVVQWRRTKYPPPTGWPVYDANIIKTSGKTVN